MSLSCSTKNLNEFSIERKLEALLSEFNVHGEVIETKKTAITTQYWFKPANGVRINRVRNLSDEVALSLSFEEGLRIYPMFHSGVIVFEVPLSSDEKVTKHITRAVAESEQEFFNDRFTIPLMLGVGIDDINTIVDLSTLPHLMVAGQTGSGKSVFLRAVIDSVLMKSIKTPVKLLLLDPKQVEFGAYSGLPQLLCDVITEADEANAALRHLITMMEERYTGLARFNCVDLNEFNAKSKISIPPIVVVIDEFADLIMQNKEVAQCIIRLAQKGRAAGIHLVIATQRPSSNVVDGLIKANFATRVAFQVASVIDSRIVLDQAGAENLAGKGDMLFSHGGRIKRLQGFYANTAVAKYFKSKRKQVA